MDDATCRYESPLGTIVLAACGDALVGLWFTGQKYDRETLVGRADVRLGEQFDVQPRRQTDDRPEGHAGVQMAKLDGERLESAVLGEAVRWLDVYFSGRNPGKLPKCAPRGTEFRQRVWKILADIPYGELATYGDIAKRIERETHKRCSARAVGGAVGHNPVSIILSCHRVVGSNGSLTGYAGGIERKIALLKLEGVDFSGLRIPAKGTAL